MPLDNRPYYIPIPAVTELQRELPNEYGDEWSWFPDGPVKLVLRLEHGKPVVSIEWKTSSAEVMLEALEEAVAFARRIVYEGYGHAR